MKRKIFSLALSLLLCAGMLYGCSQEQAGESSSQASAQSSQAAEPEESGSEASATPAPEEPELTTVEGTVEKASKNAFQLTMEDGSYLMVIITDTTEVTGDALLEGGHAVATYDPATQTGLSVPAVTLELTAPEGEGAASGEESASETETATVEGTVEKASKNAFNLVLEDGSYLMVIITDTTEATGDGFLEGNRATVTYDPATQTGLSVPAITIVFSGEAGQQAAPETETQPTGSSAEELLASMTLEEKVGQLFFVRVPAESALEDVTQYQFGGYILFGRDFKGLTAEQVRQNIAGWQSAAKVPLLIGVDEEGGTVVRASSNPNICDEPYWSPRDLYNAGGTGLVTSVEQDKINTLQNLGINVNFAPVCDISREPGAFMYDRSLGLDAQTASGVISQVVGVYQKSGMGCVLKHFPGYGNNADTHTGIAVDDRPYDTFLQQDFLPFQAGVDAGAGCVLVSHNIVTCKDGDMPASLSPTWHQVLREELGFTGCVITDDLVMDAIQDYCDASSAAVQAVLAGNDLLCCSDYETQVPAVLAAVENGTISEERVEESALRVLQWKEGLGLLQ